MSYSSELDCATGAAAAAAAILRRTFHDPSAAADAADRQAEGLIAEILTAAYPSYGYRGEELGLVRPPADAGGHCWLVDPDDGTDALAQGFRGSSVSIALLRDGRPVLGVVYAYSAPDDNGELFTWAEDAGAVRRNGNAVSRARERPPAAECTVLLSHHADRNSRANAALAAPMRFRAVPSIAYRLALVAAGEAQAAVSLNGPCGWDYAGGHALLLGAGMDLFDTDGAPVRYDRLAESGCGGRCFGGTRAIAAELAGRDWSPVFDGKRRPNGSYSLCRPVRGRSVADAGMLSRAQGCLLGQLAGDSLGSLVEFRSAEEIARRYPGGVRLLQDGGTWNTLAGQPTDDSEMALMLARSLLADGRYSADAAARAYAWWCQSHPFDIGGTTSTALDPAAAALSGGGQPALEARRHANPESQSNGALMRVSPLGIFAAGAEGGAAARLAAEDAALTHPNPVCRDANAVFASALAFAVRTGEAPEAVYAHAVTVARAVACASVVNALVAAADEPPADFMTHAGWVLIAFQNAFRQLLHAPGLEEGVVKTVMCGGDTDTNAAIAGALLGAVHGRDAIPVQWRDRVLTCRPLEGIAGVRHPRPEALWPVDALWLAEHLLFLGRAAG